MDAEARANAEYHVQQAKAHMEEYRRLRNRGTPGLLAWP